MEEFVYDVLNNDNWWWEVGRRSLVRNLLQRYGGNGLNGRNGKRPRILEIGCGAGAMLEDLEHFGSPVGMDIAEAAPQYWRKRGLDSVSLADATALPFKKDRFDVVIAIDVLEHVRDDAGAVEEMRRVCRPGGKLIATVPAFKFLWSRRDIQCHHVRRYTLEEFRGKLAHGGFRIVKSTYINMPLFFPLLMMVKAGQLSSKRAPSIKMDYALVPPPINKLLSSVVAYEARLLQHISLPIGSSIACVGTRAR
jgi:SAM-dependent methyltransferase